MARRGSRSPQNSFQKVLDTRPTPRYSEIKMTANTDRASELAALRRGADPFNAGYICADPDVCASLVRQGEARRLPGRDLVRITEKGYAAIGGGR